MGESTLRRGDAEGCGVSPKGPPHLAAPLPSEREGLCGRLGGWSEPAAPAEAEEAAPKRYPARFAIDQNCENPNVTVYHRASPKQQLNEQQAVKFSSQR